MSDLELRIGDDERQATIDRLAANFGAGRLSDEELEERTAAAHAARTRGDLAVLEADLPGPPAPDLEAGAVARRRRERIVRAVAISAFLWAIWIGRGAHGPAWPLLPTIGLMLRLVLREWGGRDEDDDRDHARRRRHRRGELGGGPPPR